MKSWIRKIVLLLAFMCTGLGTNAWATEAVREVTLSASAEESVAQDWLRMRFAVQMNAANATAVQADLKQKLNDALARVKPLAQGDALRVSTGAFTMHPRYNSAGASMGWRGQAELILEGKDFALMGEASSRLPTLAVLGIDLSVSAELARATRERVRLQAIASFQGQAQSVAKAFGFSGYELLDINVGSDSGRRAPVLMARAMSADAARAPVPVEAGQEDIAVQVTGRIRLQ